MGFYLYKGLKKPLVFFGLKGKYIFYAVGVIGSGVIAALILSKFGLLGSLLGLAITAGGVYLIFKRQDKYGLYDKTKNSDQVLIFPKKVHNKKILKNTIAEVLINNEKKITSNEIAINNWAITYGN